MDWFLNQEVHKNNSDACRINGLHTACLKYDI
jgi:hypothetical protein